MKRGCFCDIVNVNKEKQRRNSTTVEMFGSFGLPGSFYQTLLLTSVTKLLGNILSWDKNIFYQYRLLTYNALTKNPSKLF